MSVLEPQCVYQMLKDSLLFFTLLILLHYIEIYHRIFLFLISMSLYFCLAFVNICQMNKEIKSFDDKEQIFMIQILVYF